MLPCQHDDTVYIMVVLSIDVASFKKQIKLWLLWVTKITIIAALLLIWSDLVTVLNYSDDICLEFLKKILLLWEKIIQLLSPFLTFIHMWNLMKTTTPWGLGSNFGYNGLLLPITLVERKSWSTKLQYESLVS